MKKYIILLIGLFLLSGCGSKNTSIVGVWNYYSNNKIDNEIYYEFKSDNKGIYNYYGTVIDFKYELDNNKVIIEYNENSKNTYEYSIEDEILNIEDSFKDKITYKRKK